MTVKQVMEEMSYTASPELVVIIGDTEYQIASVGMLKDGRICITVKSP